MNKKLYVGNLAFSATEEQLKQHFSKCGKVESAKIIMDKMSGRSKGFAFVEMSTEDEARQALDELNGQDFGGRPLRLDLAKESAPRNFGGPKKY